MGNTEEVQPSTLRTLRFVWYHMTRQPLWLLATFFFASLTMLCNAFTPFLVSRFLQSFEGGFDPQKSLQLGFLTVFIGWFCAVMFQYFQYGLNSRYQTQVMMDILDRLHGRVQHGFVDWFGNQKVGSNVVKITRAATGYEVFADNIYLESGVILSISGSVIAAIALSFYYPFIALGVGILMSIGVILLAILTYYTVIPSNRLAIDAEDEIGGHISDRLSNNIAVKSFAGERIEHDTLLKFVRTWRVLEYRSWGCSSRAGVVYGLFLTASVAWAVWACVDYTQRGLMPLSDVAFVFFTVSTINGFTYNLGRVLLLLQRALADMEGGAALADLPIEPEGGQEQMSIARNIALKDIDFAYQDGAGAVLNIPHFEIPVGQRIGLVGHSGAGKTTFVGLLMRFYDVSQGSISIDGTDVRYISLKTLRDHIAVIPQDTTLFHRSLMDNIRYGNPQASDEEVIEAAKRAHADEFISQLPNGYETLVGERGVKLSGGQRQRIAIARAILKDAPILILDEATSALDSESEKLIQDSLKELMVGKTVIAIAHRLSTIAHLDRLIVMEDGKIVEDGTHDELRARGGVYANLWDMQSGGFLGE